MDFFLIGAGWLDLGWWFGILQVAIGLGMVIFVHELGHFAVAKMCGVKCEKFYLGFDIGGLKLFKLTVGETEYGIGILPLGGYVKMLGQEDNPARLREEIERAKQKAAKQDTAEDKTENKADDQQAADTRANSESAEPKQSESTPTSEKETPETDGADSSEGDKPTESSNDDDEIDLAAAEAALYDPRSYLAQSVPKRMAIISAGVIMNLIFACIMATIAYRIGVKQVVCGVGQLVPGKTAWQLDLKVGDLITVIDGRKMRHFRDLKANVSLGNIKNGLPIEVQRPDVTESLKVVTVPDTSGQMPVIGVAPPRDTTLAWVVPGSAAAKAKPPLEDGDKLVKIDEAPIGNSSAGSSAGYPKLHAYLALHPEKTLTMTVERQIPTAKGETQTDDPPTEELTVEVPPNPMRRLGLVMEMGPITAVQDNSPAAEEGIKADDMILKIDGQPPGDPLTLPARLQRRAGDTIHLTVQRGSEHLDVPITLRKADWYEAPLSTDAPMSIPAMGIAYEVLNRVESTIEGSPAAKAGLQPGDQIVEAVILPPDKEPDPDLPKPRKKTVSFDPEEHNWPYLIHVLQVVSPDRKVELTWTRQDEKQTAQLTPVAARDWFNPDRGFQTGYLLFTQQGETWGEAIRFGVEETADSTLLVFRVLSKLGSQFSATNLGGPIMIFAIAKGAADQGISELLIFLTIISANLAVINFLPIPVLDGGHMVLLTYEGIRRKPPDERIVAILTWFGLIFILSLMFWVIGMDIHRLFTGF